MDKMTRSYLETALRTGTDEADESGGEPLDENYSVEDFDEESVERAEAECLRFAEENSADLEHVPVSPDGNSPRQYAGYLFWLSRCGHGAGFFDRDEIPEEVRDRLQEAARKAGERYAYVGDDGKLYIS